jgi:hypothetical protein
MHWYFLVVVVSFSNEEEEDDKPRYLTSDDERRPDSYSVRRFFPGTFHGASSTFFADTRPYEELRKQAAVSGYYTENNYFETVTVMGRDLFPTQEEAILATYDYYDGGGRVSHSK